MCPWYDQMPLTIEVKNGEVVSIAASNGEDVTPYLETYNRSAYGRGVVCMLFNQREKVGRGRYQGSL